MQGGGSAGRCSPQRRIRTNQQVPRDSSSGPNHHVSHGTTVPVDGARGTDVASEGGWKEKEMLATAPLLLLGWSSAALGSGPLLLLLLLTGGGEDRSG